MRGCVTWEGGFGCCVGTVNPGGIEGMAVDGWDGIGAVGDVAFGAMPEPLGFCGSMVGMIVGEFADGVGCTGDVESMVYGVCV